jgi:muconolactone delta-isomerase
MRFLVTIDASDGGAGMPPERLTQVVNEVIVPSLEQLAQWEQEGRIHGGGYTAARGGVFIIDADSPEEVDQLVTSLPYWGIVKVEVKPLIPSSAVVERAWAIGQRLQGRVR